MRVSVTDRCDFRCVYCMAEDMTFLPKKDVLSLEELDRLCSAFVARGVRKLRLTGGEPLVRKNIMSLVRSLSRHIASGALDELTLTTNGSQLARFAGELADCGVRRINVSVDTLDPDKFKAITRWGELDKVMDGIAAARAAGLKIKINAVALKDVNELEFDELIRWAHGEGMDLTLIETMPLGEIDGDRTDQYLPLSLVRSRLASAGRSATSPTRPAARRAMSRSARPAAGSASSRRSPTISAKAATASASPAPARSTCASARRMPPTSARRSAPRRATTCSRRRSTRRSRASPRATTSSSTARTRSPPSPAT